MHARGRRTRYGYVVVRAATIATSTAVATGLALPLSPPPQIPRAVTAAFPRELSPSRSGRPQLARHTHTQTRSVGRARRRNRTVRVNRTKQGVSTSVPALPSSPPTSVTDPHTHARAHTRIESEARLGRFETPRQGQRVGAWGAEGAPPSAVAALCASRSAPEPAGEGERCVAQDARRDAHRLRGSRTFRPRVPRPGARRLWRRWVVGAPLLPPGSERTTPPTFPPPTAEWPPLCMSPHPRRSLDFHDGRHRLPCAAEGEGEGRGGRVPRGSHWMENAVWGGWRRAGPLWWRRICEGVNEVEPPFGPLPNSDFLLGIGESG